MSIHPTTKRIEAGHYEMSCDKETLSIKKGANVWNITHKEGVAAFEEPDSFMTKSAASDFAYCWIQLNA